MKIYTKTGDSGETSLFGGERVKKTNLRLDVYGTIDEANSFLGLVISFLRDSLTSSKERTDLLISKQTLIDRFTDRQSDLFTLGAELATPANKKVFIDVLNADSITVLEREIDQMEAMLPALKNFILPTGTKTSSALHCTRTIVRRAERLAVGLAQMEPIREEVIQYLNRLSDYLFVCARYAGHIESAIETEWIPTHTRSK